MMALPYSYRGSAKVIWVVLHTAEGSRRASDLYNFFNANQNASSHVGIDSTGYYDWVDRRYAAWTLLNGNPISVNAEICGFAKWTREQWLSTGTVDGVVNPRQMVRNAALWAKRECEALGIPKVYIGTDGVRNRQSGIIIHWDYSKGTGDGDHWDTGYNFPWDVFFADMGVTTTPEEEEDMPLDADRDYVAFKTMLQRYMAFESRPGGAAPTHLNGPTIFERLAEIVDKVTAIKAELAALQVDGVPVTAEVDWAAGAKAVADEQDRRARDGDPSTGPVS